MPHAAAPGKRLRPWFQTELGWRFILRRQVWTARHRDDPDAAGHGLEEAVVQSTQIGAINSWLRNQPQETIATCVASLGDALIPYSDGKSVRLPGPVWLISTSAA